MAVVKKSRSGRAVQFILSEDVPAGTVFQLSASLFGRVMSEDLSGDFVVLTRLPIPVPGSKYPVSRVWVDGGLVDALDASSDGGVLVDPSSRDFLAVRDGQRVVERSKEVKVDW